MTSRDLAFLLVGAVGAPCAIALLVLISNARSKADKPPTVAGQSVPDQHVTLDFSNRFNIYRRDVGTNQVWRDCRFVGFTGPYTETRGFGSSSGYGYFHKWLVVETADHRRLYIRPESIDYLEDTTATVP